MLLRQTVLLNLEQVPEEKKANIKLIFLRGRGKIGNYGLVHFSLCNNSNMKGYIFVNAPKID